jgi:hypothetical protein
MTETIRIQNIQNYIIEYINGDLILTPKQQPVYITEDEVILTPVTGSTVLECNIKDVEGLSISSGKTKYKQILVDIFKTMEPTTIIKNSTFNFKLTNEHGLNGYHWDPCLKLSIQSKCANDTLKEIIRMVKFNNCSIKLCIKLKTAEIIHFKN